MKEQASARAEARACKQRKRILDAARQCFIREGFHAASMASLAATAKMSAGLIYHYFDSKSAIILAIIEEQLEERRANIAEAVGNADRLAGSEFCSWLTRLAAARGHKLPAREAKARVLLLQVFIEGLATRAARDPGFDAADLTAALDYLLAMVMCFEPRPPYQDIAGERRSR